MPMYKVSVDRWICDQVNYEVWAESEHDALILGKYKAIDNDEKAIENDIDPYDEHNFRIVDISYKPHKAVCIASPTLDTETEIKPKIAAKKKVSNKK